MLALANFPFRRARRTRSLQWIRDLTAESHLSAKDLIWPIFVMEGKNQVEEIKSTLNKRFDKQINIESSVDKTLIGGAIIRAGDLVIDGSARGKLTKLADTLTRS